MNELLNRKEYSFLKDIDNDLCLLALSGSRGYGTDVEGSDIDIRGVRLSTRDEILGFRGKDGIIDDFYTDTLIYPMNRFIELLSQSKVNVLELLGFEESKYLKMNTIGKMLYENRDLFISKEIYNAIKGFSNNKMKTIKTYANSADNDRLLDFYILEDLIVTKVMEFNIRNNSSLKIKLNKDNKGELWIDIKCDKLHRSKAYGCIKEISDIVKLINNRRANTKIYNGDINKDAMNVIRWYLMGIDIMEKGDIITNREHGRDTLLNIRNTEIINEDGTINKEFLELEKELRLRLEEAYNNSKLKEKVNKEKINELAVKINLETLRYRGIA